MLLIPVHYGNYFHCRLLQRRANGFSNFGSLWDSISNLQQLSSTGSLPISVFGVARVTSRHQDSHDTSSSPFPNHPKPPLFFFLFSKNCTTREPRMLLLGDEVEVSCLISCPTRVSMRVSTSGSGTRGRVKSRISRYEGRIGEK